MADKKTFIRSLSANAGFLEDCRIDFSDGLTCIIGARGTCKSTLVESLRFALNEDPARLAKLTASGSRAGGSSSDGMLTATLGAGTIRCEVEETSVEGSTLFHVEREIGAEPRIYEAGVRDFGPAPGTLRVEVLSQGDLQELAVDSSNELRLRLVDRRLQPEIDNERRERANRSAELKVIGEQIRTLRLELASLRQSIQPHGLLEEQLSRIEKDSPKPSEALAHELTLFEARRAIVTSAAALDETVRATQADLAALPLVALAKGAGEIIKSPETTDKAPWELALSVISRLAEATTAFQSLHLGPSVTGLRNEFDERSERFFQLRQEEQQVNEAIKQASVLRKQLDIIRDLQQRHAALEETLTSLMLKRRLNREALALHDSEIYRLRSNEIQDINTEYYQLILLALSTSHGGSRYERTLNELLQGSRVRLQEEVAKQLSELLPPSTLLDLVENADASQLAELSNRDLGQMSRIVSHLGEHPRLYELELVEPMWILDITFYDGESAKPVETLSKGQRATALLPIVLRPLSYPLIVDQPEDDLDNYFIFSFLVKKIQELSKHRQLIFVTHNANIPVLGDADRVVVMSMRSPTKADQPKQGTVEDCKESILNLLEGGREAFKLREERYHDLLRSEVVES